MSDIAVNGNGVPIADRLPPQNLDAECGLLGSMLLDNAVIPDVAAIVRPAHFYRNSHEIICGTIYELYGESAPVDAITVADRLTLRGDLERCDGVDYLISLIHGVPHAANAAYYAQIIKEKSVQRGLIGMANEILRDVYAQTSTAEELLESAEVAVYSMAELDRESRKQVTADEGAGEVIGQLVRAKESGHIPGIRSGLVAIDLLTGGWEGDQVIALAARPSMGKTALAIQIASQIGEIHGLGALYISLEMGQQEISSRLLAARAGVPYELFRNPRALGDEHFARLADAYEAIRKLPPFVIDDSHHINAQYIASSARRWKMKKGIGVIVVDYLQIVETGDSRDSRQEEVAKISRRLKSISREVGAPVIAVCQLNRSAENREDHRPRMADLRESGQIEQDAHQVLLLYRPEYYAAGDHPGMAEVIVAKNRNGPTGSAWLQFDKPYMRFADLAFPDGDGAPF